tara:strand:- start:3995 stop:6418 length:2424 start_codon:yes stop_codon:yes gene_type:complete
MEKTMLNFIRFNLLVLTICLAQVSTPSTPKSFYIDENIPLSTVTLPSFDVDQFLIEDDNEMRSVDTKPYRFANPISVNLNMNNAGIWTELEDGSMVWMLEIESVGAFSLNIIYDIFDIPDGAEFFVYSDDMEMVLGAFTSFNHKPHGGFSTAPVKGDKIILEYNQPSNASFDGNISISTIAHDYRNVFFNEERGYGDSGSCNNNVACSVGDDWQDEIRSVAMILTSGGSRLCTGSLINNATQDLSPYFLTANHCLGGNNSWIFMFNYESPQCSNQNGPTNMTVSGSSLLASSSTSDVALLLLNETPPQDYNVHYAGWDVSGSTPSIPVGIHHPSGDIKKISFDYDNASNSGNYWDVDSWDDGTTEPGSSGSPLFDGQTHRIIGQLYGGVASCTNFGYDTYGKTSVSWNLGLSDYLDPNNTGLSYIDGIDAIDLPDPELSLSNINLDFELENDESDLSSITISNTGEDESVLFYSLSIRSFENPMGGPDNINNFWSDSNNESNLESEWIDISDIGTLYEFDNNDESGEVIDIGFDFPFYGQNRDQLFINPNGWIGFGDDSNAWDNTSIPSNSAPRSAIFGFWDDLNPVNNNCNSCSGEVLYHSNDDRMVVWFNDVAHWPTNFENSFYDFQIVIFKTGEIKFNYNNMVGISNSATIGIQNDSGNSGLQMSYNTEYVENELTTFVKKNPTWAGINQLENFDVSGELLEGSSVNFNIIVENNELTEGNYSANLNISSNASTEVSFPILLMSSSSNITGDINGDSLVNVIDVVQLVSIALGESSETSSADLNDDGVINVLDVIFLVNIVLAE